MTSPRARRSTLVVLVLGTLLTAACGIDEDRVSGVSSNELTVTTQPPESTIPPLDADDLRNVAASVQDFWERTMPEVFDQAYETIPGTRIVAGTPGTTFPVCRNQRLSYDDVEGNAFAAPCPEGITVVWDDAALVPDLIRRFGSVAPAIVLAHEWGHVAQFEVGIDVQTVIMEQQADCFAGAWLADLLDDPGGLTELAQSNPLDTSLKSIIEFRDQPGSSAQAQTAHGSGFDRVRALQEGFERGAQFCSTYIDNPPTLIDLQFTTQDELASGGNLELDELLPLVIQDLNDFYGAHVEGFEGSSEAAVRSNPDAMEQLQDLSNRVGDNGAGLVVALVWARFAQQQTGANKGRDAFGQLQQQACLTGGWMQEVLTREPAEGTLTFSPGDVDEAITSLIDLGTPKDIGATTDGGLFALVASLRQGVVDGFDSCGLK
jgi:hypothetical protein